MNVMNVAKPVTATVKILGMTSPQTIATANAGKKGRTMKTIGKSLMLQYHRLSLFARIVWRKPDPAPEATLIDCKIAWKVAKIVWDK